MPANDFHGKLLTMKIMLAGAAVLLAALAATAGPATADPNPFGTLGCSCSPVAGIPPGNPDVKDQVDRGIQNGLGSLHRKPGS